ncbi:1-propanol dehydrogenase PduQ [Desulforamulus hydrothermalis]|uniref:Fe-containing alcohol dehydrogenase n=1 Tax=Desulforamulus hydrothermalis Lam5 = DSM 18033 TaxID=1121428 RepID=K8DY78_9FIRM|nr:1-propanol dehydrogenase PduQ [Desulforamulus hydrothermalis]CCO07714.1 Fe-containing alcohol dehydrogenase [Desulforamulus hydrothermalis Lam5 = DSM 18033]SHH33583.1 Alcohol dehydrogenase, class IV [Desulforamulus hydrothermalis Lam5 = DSM 18033]
MKRFTIMPKIYFNEGSMQFLKEIKGSFAFIVSDAIMEKLGYLQKAIDYLAEAGLKTAVFTDVRPDPDVKVIAAGMQKYLAAQADVVVALGGGSVIDAAKGILYSLWQFKKAAGEEFKKPLFIAIPSTSGTGSEVTNFSVITADGQKVVIVDEWMAPDIAILDSTCIQHVPQPVVADTGMDALVHAIEAYVSTEATPCTDALAEKAVQLIFENLKTLYNDTGNVTARERMQNASCIAGMAFTNAGLGINHSLAHALGGTFHIPHGRANALLLSAVIEYNADLNNPDSRHVAERYARLANVINLPARTYREGVVNFLQAVKDLKKSLGIPDGISQLGIDKNKFEDQLANMALIALNDRCTATNPKQPSQEDLRKILCKSF